MTAKEFHVMDILSVYTGVNCGRGGINAVYALCNFLSGERAFTHQLKRIADEARPWLLLDCPWLANFGYHSEYLKRELQRDFDDAQRRIVARYGEYHAVHPIPPDDHQVIDPYEELTTNYPHLMTIIIDLTDGGQS